MEHQTCFILIFFLSSVLSSVCLHAVGLKELFDSEIDKCNGEETWNFGNYTFQDDRRHLYTFVSPKSVLSCLTSRNIYVSAGDTFEFNMHMKSTNRGAEIMISVYDAANDSLVGQTSLRSASSDFVEGWSVLNIVLGGTKSYTCYITLLGYASDDAAVALQSVRHISMETGAINLYQIDNINQKDQPSSDQENIPTISAETTSINSELIPRSMQVLVERSENRNIEWNDFWTPLTISLAVIIPLVILVFLAWGCFALGKTQGTKEVPPIIFEDVNNMPKPYIVPRAKIAYTDSEVGSTYGRSNAFAV